MASFHDGSSGAPLRTPFSEFHPHESLTGACEPAQFSSAAPAVARQGCAAFRHLHHIPVARKPKELSFIRNYLLLETRTLPAPNKDPQKCVLFSPHVPKAGLCPQCCGHTGPGCSPGGRPRHYGGATSLTPLTRCQEHSRSRRPEMPSDSA